MLTMGRIFSARRLCRTALVDGFFVFSNHKQVYIAPGGVCSFSIASKKDSLAGDRFELIKKRNKDCQVEQNLEIADQGVGGVGGVERVNFPRCSRWMRPRVARSARASLAPP